MRTDAGWTYGVRLEWPDVDSTQDAWPGWWWDPQCTSIVNSDGSANDPLRQLVRLGGALVSPAAASPEELARVVEEVWLDLLPSPNYRCNLRVDVSVPGLAEDLAAVRQITTYTRKHLANLWPAVDPLESLIPAPSTEEHRTMAREYREQTLRPARRHLLSDKRHEVRMSASTVGQFIATGSWRFNGDRESVMVTGDGAVQLRCLAHPVTPRELHAAVEFSRMWVLACLNGTDALGVALRWGTLLPRQLPFDPDLEQGWRRSNFRDHTREEVGALLGRR